ncbi:MAG UNVERIFIED_CONTAM: ester cyclase [Anaerolineae bacterium]
MCRSLHGRDGTRMAGYSPTHKTIAMRYHEFFRIEDGQIVEMQALWDIPQVMMQANAWAFSPSLGVEWLAPLLRHRTAF